jgi:DNA-binding GntR family transcriptional regulator
MPRDKSDYSTVKRPAYLSLADIAYNALIEAIINQEFAPGSPVSIDSLARQLKMSNTPVREALMRANGEGLVAQKTNHGFVVADILTAQELHQLFDVRHTLELHALSGVVVSRRDIEELQTLMEQMSKSKDGAVYNDFKDYLQLDHQFHRVLVALSGNPFLLTAWEDLHVHLHLSRLYTGIGLFDRDDSVVEHQAIVEALQQNDNLQVLSLISQHIKRVGKSMEAFLAG